MKLDLCNMVVSHDSIVVRGGGTKNALGCGRRLNPSAAKISTTEMDIRPLQGIVTYDPSEFLITANAGTLISDLKVALSENGQYFPFDPVFAAGGATLGGTIASGISGPNKLLYGGLRDFVMEVELIDGLGRLVRGGGKVVKNAAGFDTPKLMVGSYGRLGVLLEATLKVFPMPPAVVTAKFELRGLAEVLQAMQKLQGNPLPISALEIERPNRLVVRFAGRDEALAIVVQRAQRILSSPAVVEVNGPEEAAYWQKLCEFAYVPTNSKLIRVAMSGRKLLALDEQLQQVQGISTVRYSNGCSVAWLVAAKQFDVLTLNRFLLSQNLSAIVVVDSTNDDGHRGLQLLGDTTWVSLSERLKNAMDPYGKFSNYIASDAAALTPAETETADAP